MAPEQDLSQRFQLGPYLQGAFICEQVLVEQNGVVSFIRVIDRIQHFVTGPDQPVQTGPLVYDINIVVLLKSGENSGNFEVGVQPIKPNNERMPALRYTVNLEAPNYRGANVIGKVRFPFDMPGTWWFDITLNNIRITRIPMQIIYLPMPTLGPT